MFVAVSRTWSAGIENISHKVDAIKRGVTSPLFREIICYIGMILSIALAAVGPGIAGIGCTYHLSPAAYAFLGSGITCFIVFVILLIAHCIHKKCTKDDFKDPPSPATAGCSS